MLRVVQKSIAFVFRKFNCWPNTDTVNTPHHWIRKNLMPSLNVSPQNDFAVKHFFGAATTILYSWCPPWFHPPPFTSPLFKGPPLIRNIHPPLFSTFSGTGVPIPWYPISFIKSFKTPDFSKHVSQVLKLWYYTWKPPQIYYNIKVKEKIMYTSYSLAIFKFWKHNLPIWW